MPTKKEPVDVRKPADLKKLLDVIAKHPITVILIHADFCGHCKTYKEKVWNEVSAMPEAKNGVASIHYDQLEGTPFADAKIKGYPSVIVVGKKKMAEFEDEEAPGEKTNAITMEEANDVEKMKTLIASTEPSTLTGTLKNVSTNVDAETPSPELSPEAESMRENEPMDESEVTAEPQKFSVPDERMDVLNSQKKASNLEFTPEQANESPRAGKGAAVGGGNLYASLLEAARTVAPAAALTAAAVAMRRGSRKSRKTRKGSKGRKTRKGRR